MNGKSGSGLEWPTLLLLLTVYVAIGLGTTGLYTAAPLLGFLVTGIALAQFSSLQHEALHGHPFRDPVLNEAAVFPALNPFVPYRRFRDTHLAHHNDPILTDPYDDPESNYLDPEVWARLPRWQRRLYRLNNTLLGRMLVGPAIGTAAFLAAEWRLAQAGDLAVRRAWGLHALGLVPVVLWLHDAAMPLWVWLAAVYLSMSLLRIRTFLEHRAHEKARARTVIIEDRGPLALLFLNNNLHVVHHMHPGVAWYRLPALYREKRARFLERNEGYVYRSYAEIFRRYLTRAKDPVPHPFYHGEGG